MHFLIPFNYRTAAASLIFPTQSQGLTVYLLCVHSFLLLAFAMKMKAKKIKIKKFKKFLKSTKMVSLQERDLEANCTLAIFLPERELLQLGAP